MDKLYKKLCEIRKNPEEYLQEKSLIHLRTYIFAYLKRQYEIDGNSENILNGFQKFIENKYNISHVNWDEILCSKYGENVAFNKFYINLEEYIAKYIPLKESEKKGTIVTLYEKRQIKEIHYTSHGNPKRCTNPHEHKVNWYPDGCYTFDFSLNIRKGIKVFERKSSQAKFESLDEFINNLERGGEIEFTFDEENYSITHGDGNFYIMKIGDELSESVCKEINEVLDYKIGSDILRDSISKIKVIFRCF